MISPIFVDQQGRIGKVESRRIVHKDNVDPKRLISRVVNATVSRTAIVLDINPTSSKAIQVTNNNNALFSVQPYVSNITGSASGQTASILFEYAPYAVGTVTVTVTCQDNGGTANGGQNTNAQTFIMEVCALFPRVAGYEQVCEPHIGNSLGSCQQEFCLKSVPQSSHLHQDLLPGFQLGNGYLDCLCRLIPYYSTLEFF